jgi:hypothetical protein
MDELFQHSEACYTALAAVQIELPVILNHCQPLVTQIHQRPWILSEFPYPLLKVAVECLSFHGIMLLLTKMFCLGV